MTHIDKPILTASRASLRIHLSSSSLTTSRRREPQQEVCSGSIASLWCRSEARKKHVTNDDVNLDSRAMQFLRNT